MDKWEIKEILKPIKLGKLISRNRILMASHSYGYADDNGLPTDYLVNYLVERAKGGVGLIIMGGTAVSPSSSVGGHTTMNIDEQIIPWYKKISDEVHMHGALIFDQLFHAGGQLSVKEGRRIVAPSPIPHERTRSTPVELTIGEIIKIQKDYIDAAERVRVGGLDGVEIKCDQGFLIQQFLSPYYNRRKDVFGGSYENRLRFLLEILSGIREKVNNNLVVGVRITGNALSEGDLTSQDSVRIANDLENSGYVDFIHVSGATNSTFNGYLLGHGDDTVGQMNFSQFAKEIKKHVDLPVIASSKISHPAEAEGIITSHMADMVAMTRPHIADPEIVNKVIENRIDDIRPCIYCNQGCVGNHYSGGNVRCIYNSATGREVELGIGTIQKNPTAKIIAIIGGGIAGMEVARVAALRGNEVHLFEKETFLGGQLMTAAKLPYRSGFLDIVKYLEKQIRKLNVHVHNNSKIVLDELSKISIEVDAIVIATGGKPFVPPIYTEVESERILGIEDLINEKVHIGKNILVVDSDWRQNSLGIAELLLRRGRQVTVITSNFMVAEQLDIVSLTSYYSRLYNVVNFLPLTSLVSLSHGTARLRNVLNNKIVEVSPVDQVVFTTGAIPNKNLYLEAKTKFKNVYAVGDCVTPAGIPEAILSANRLARIV